MISRPRAVVVAGPSGSGKSWLFPVADFGVDAFNVDDRCADLNGGSYVAIPAAVRSRAQRECEAFVDDHIARGSSYAVETTLRSTAAIDQARRARASGFETVLLFIATGDAAENQRRVALRAHAGGHAATLEEIADIYTRSLANLALAVDVFEWIELWDNSELGRPPVLVATRAQQRWRRRLDPIPKWASVFVPRIT